MPYALMYRIIVFLFAFFAGTFAIAQNSVYIITNTSPKSGSLSQSYTVSLSVEASSAKTGENLTFNSETYSIAPGATQNFLITIPDGYTVQPNTAVFRVNTGSCNPFNFTVSSERVRGNAAGCYGVYHVTQWTMTDPFHFSIAAGLIPGGM